MPPQDTHSSVGIKWNEVTWYSKLGAIILFVGVVPALTFYVGIQYQAVIDVEPTPLIVPESNEPNSDAPIWGMQEHVSERIINERKTLALLTKLPSGTLTKTSHGVLYFQENKLLFNNWDAQDTAINPVFISNLNAEHTEIIGSVEASELRWAQPFLSGNKLYYLSNHPDIKIQHREEFGPSGEISMKALPIVKALDIFTKETKETPLPYTAEDPILSFYVTDSSFYYTTGEYTSEYWGTCEDTSLKHYNLLSGVNETVLNGLKACRITGFVNKEMVLETRPPYECADGRYQALEFSSKTLRDLPSYDFCEEGPGSERIQEILTDRILGPTLFNFVVQNGMLFSTTTGSTRPATIRVDPQEYPLSK